MTTITRATPLIETETGDYPLFLSDVTTRLKNTLLPTSVDSELLKELGYEVVNPTDRPEGDAVYQGAPEKKNGEWYITWIVRDHTEEEKEALFNTLKERQDGRITQFRNTEFAKGFPFNFDEGTYHVQVRTTDVTNILSLRTAAKEALAEDTPFVVPFRVWENVTVSVDAQTMVALGNAALVQVSAAYERVWAFKDQVKNATNEAELPEDYETLFNV